MVREEKSVHMTVQTLRWREITGWAPVAASAMVDRILNRTCGRCFSKQTVRRSR